MKTLFLVFIFLLASFVADSQEEQIIEIRKLYNEYNELINKAKVDGVGFFPTRFTISGDQMQRAIGLVSTTSTIYYDQEDRISESQESGDVIYDRFIRKVVTTHEFAGKIYKEYFFDKKGNLIFFYLKEEKYEFHEERYYFRNNKIIKVMRKGLPDSKNGVSSDFTHTEANFTTDDKNNANAILKTATKYTKLLKAYEGTNPESVYFY